MSHISRCALFFLPFINLLVIFLDCMRSRNRYTRRFFRKYVDKGLLQPIVEIVIDGMKLVSRQKRIMKTRRLVIWYIFITPPNTHVILKFWANRFIFLEIIGFLRISESICKRLWLSLEFKKKFSLTSNRNVTEGWSIWKSRGKTFF